MNGKVYIGQTGQELKDRFGCNGANYKHSRHFWNAIQKYGWDNFKHISLINGVSLEVANIVEEMLIKKYNAMNNKYGYNMIAGGNNRARRQEVTDEIAEKNRHPSPETLRKMSIASTGRKHTLEVIEKIRKSNIGKKRSKEARKKMSIAKQNISEETRRKISEAGKGRKVSQKCIELNRKRFIGNRLRAKPIAQYDFEGNFIKEWGCAMDVEKELHINHGNIGKCCNSNQKSAGGYQWKYFIGDKSNINPIGVHKNQRNIDQYDIEGNYLKTWDSLSEISNQYNYASSNIAKCCNRKISSAYGYIWRYKNSKEDSKGA